MNRLTRAITLAVLTLPLAFSAYAAPEAKTVEVNSPLLSRAPFPSDYTMGKKDAPVKMIEYASMSCSHCAHFHKEVLPVIQKNYIDTGKVFYIFRHYPLNEPALKAAMLTDCVGEDSGPERFFTFVRVLFESQNKWAFEGNFLSSLETFAKVGGVSKERFEACMKDTAREVKILGIKKDATDKLGVDRTPIIFINNQRYNGAPVPTEVTAYINTVLGKDAPLVDEMKEPAAKKK